MSNYDTRYVCWDGRRHKRKMTEAEAEYAVEDVFRRRGEVLGVYRCPKKRARHYHIGHVPERVVAK